MQYIDTQKLNRLIISEFSDIVENVIEPFTNELRVNLIDGSFIKFWFSLKLSHRFSYHWERRKITGKIYRHDNSPHVRWKDIKTYPKHFHNETEENVEASFISDIPDEAVREMLTFVDEKIKSQ